MPDFYMVKHQLVIDILVLLLYSELLIVFILLSYVQAYCGYVRTDLECVYFTDHHQVN